ncbi:MAG TPA: histidine kinase, partial [Chitinophagaceae bacterium]|nr:histidine kinase [Chitinophagaceae bacterium]
MTLKTLIFSEEKSVRIKRHLLFWSCWLLHFCMTHAANAFGKPEISYFQKPKFTILESILLILIQVPIVYLMIYIVLPVFFLKRRYVLGVLATNLLWFLAGAITFVLIESVFPSVTSFLLSPEELKNTQRPTGQSFFMSVMFLNKGVFTVMASALVIKFAKYWYLKEQRNIQLLKENADAQLQLLTAQVHPHFLFNTLNNIYSQAQNESPKSSKMIMGLS